MKQLTVKILIGIPASGKSTWKKGFLEKNQGWVAVGRDDFRYMLQDKGWCEPKIESLINDLIDTTIIKSLVGGQNVIIDNTNVKESYINHYCKLVEEYADVEYLVFDVPLKTALERDALRERKVGKDVITKMYNSFLVLKDSFHFQPQKQKRKKTHLVPNFKSDLPDAVCFDMDGTLALMGDRGPFDWDKVDRDNLNDIIAEQIEYHTSKGRKIIILTGRDGAAKDLTQDWLDYYQIGYDYIFTRAEGDFRKDSVIKTEIYNRELKDKFNILCVYDDRIQVVKMWYDLGVFCFNVNQGNKEF